MMDMDEQSSAPLPTWMSQSVPTTPTGSVGTAISEFPSRYSEMSVEMRQLEQQTFQIAFETLLEAIAAGTTLTTFCREYHVRLWPGRFRTWIFSDRRRRSAFEAAKAVGAEVIEDEMLSIADGITAEGTAAPSDVQRSHLQISVRKWILGVWNRERYGDVKKVEQTTTITSNEIAGLSTEDLKKFIIEATGKNDFDLLGE